MSSAHNGEGGIHQETDFAQAFQDLARGERAAAALENHLESLEKKIEELLAKANEAEREAQAGAHSDKVAGSPPADKESKDSA